MTCWGELKIEMAAIMLVHGRTDEETETRTELEAITMHARSCQRCGALLAMFTEVETRFSREMSQMLRLVPARGRQPAPEGSGPESNPQPEFSELEYAVAWTLDIVGEAASA